MDIPTNMVLQTERLLLRFPKLEDSEKITSIVRLPNFPARLPLKEMSSTNEIKDWLKRLQEGWVKGQVFSWIVDELDSGQMVGQVTLSKVAGDNRWALAFWTHPDYWGKGYATEGVEKILKFGFEALGAETIWAGAGDWNKGSCRVLEKVGMIFIGENPKGYYSKGEPLRTREYELSRKKWQIIMSSSSSRLEHAADRN